MRLERVTVSNTGVDWACPGNLYWKHEVARKQALRIEVQGSGEFEAFDVTLAGDLHFVVPDGHRMSITTGEPGRLLWWRVLGRFSRAHKQVFCLAPIIAPLALFKVSCTQKI